LKKAVEVVVVVAFANREPTAYVGGEDEMTSNPSGNGLIAAPTAVLFCVNVMLLEFSVV